MIKSRHFIFILYISVHFTAHAQISVIAHRGASAYETENSLAAFRKAFKLKADAIEMDIWRTTDDSLVVIHDRTTGRIANGNLIVPESTAADLRALRLNNGEQIPFLSEAIRLLPKRKKMVIEIKNFKEKGNAGTVFPMLSDLLKKSGRANDAIIISFGAEVLAEAKKYLPECKCYYLSGKEMAEEELINTCLKLKLDGLNVHYKILTVSLAEKAKQAGLDLLVWTVDDPELVKQARGKVSGITTNKPDVVRKYIKK
ncbi:MAG: glycerophosphodiester phosphodiesterase family protein [Paludibacter sp.]|nr:glycerophosphodiester phosphodiesterase family protein [Paludibacter sp.]